MATLLHHWKLDENTGTSCVDAAGNGALALNVVGSYPAWVSGKLGAALEFSGTDGALNRFSLALNDVAWLETRTVGCGRAWSFCAWIKCSNNIEARPIISVWQDTQVNGSIDALYLGRDGKIYLHVPHKKVATTYSRWAVSTSIVDDDGWHFVVGTYDGGATDNDNKLIRVYIDAALEATYTETDQTLEYVTTGLSSTTMPILVGGGSVWCDDTASFIYPSTKLATPIWDGTKWLYGNPFGSFDGIVDDARIYCGALTQGEIDDLYNDRKVANAIMFSCNT